LSKDELLEIEKVLSVTIIVVALFVEGVDREGQFAASSS